MSEPAPAAQAPAGAVSLPRDATLLAFDYGMKRIGVALGNTLTRTARALTIVPNQDREQRFRAVGALIAEWKPGLLVVGLPLHPDGAPHEMTQQAKRFGNQLNGRFNLPVRWVDERYSSRAARSEQRERGQPAAAVDAEAARIILQQFFDEWPDYES